MPPSSYQRAIFIFRRDYRLSDNLGLIQALTEAKHVLPIFIFTPEQIQDSKNPYKSDAAVQFMIESLQDLDSRLKKYSSKLFYFYGSPADVIKKLLVANSTLEAVYVNQDYSPYSNQRDKQLAQVCQDHKRAFHSYHDALLNPFGSVRTEGGQIYSKFTPYFIKARSQKILNPQLNKRKNYFPIQIANSSLKLPNEYTGDGSEFYTYQPALWQAGGRSAALGILKDLSAFKDYNKSRNDLTDHTTYLSAYLKFGCVSIRETYHMFRSQLGMKNDLVKQLYWRDFYANILQAYPRVVGGALKEKYDQIKWVNNDEHFQAWCQGKTGYPIVDAGMRSMNETGFMHNRARLIVSNFLIKLLQVDWRWGEKYFSQQLMDIDIANNNGNWQWGAGTGADSQPYFRIFNPWSQSKKHDPEAHYIKTWCPELAEVPAPHLHQWDKYVDQYPDLDYPAPIVEYEQARQDALTMYKAIF